MEQVSNENQNILREKKLMSANEIAYIQGDLLVVVDVVTESKRVLGKTQNFLNESVNRRVLKG